MLKHASIAAPVFVLSKSREWDLHDRSLAAACMLLADSLMLVAEQRLFEKSNFVDIIVVTGRGLGSGPTGPVLRAGVPNFLRKMSGPEISLVKGNNGRFLITRQALQIWVESGNLDVFKHRITRDLE